jgi:hypothetical protein
MLDGLDDSTTRPPPCQGAAGLAEGHRRLSGDGTQPQCRLSMSQGVLPSVAARLMGKSGRGGKMMETRLVATLASDFGDRYNRYGSYGTRYYGSGYNGYGSYGPQYYGSDYNGSGYDGVLETSLS